MAEQNTCANCGEAIGFFDKSVRMVRRVDVTTMNPAGQRQREDGLASTFSRAMRAGRPSWQLATRRVGKPGH